MATAIRAKYVERQAASLRRQHPGSMATTPELKIANEMPAQADVRLRANFRHMHDVNGRLITRAHEIEGSYPVGEETGLRIVHDPMRL